MPATDRIRVMLLLWSLEGGGAERVAVNLANHLDPEEFQVRMGLLRRHGPYLNLVNVFNRKNVFLYTVDTDTDPPQVKGASQLPFLPSIGLRMEW